MFELILLELTTGCSFEGLFGDKCSIISFEGAGGVETIDLSPIIKR